ncbi:MAG: aminomethyl transferase family protein [Thermomicrobium sp.]|nr:aminomethyl transferase family protein [Thermomicrobium sp.]
MGTFRNVQELIDSVGNVVHHLSALPKGVLPRITTLQPPPHVLLEYTGWRDEQRAWRESVGLTDLSWHLTNLYLRGPDSRLLLGRLATNDFAVIRPGRAKQFLACAPTGYVIGDALAYCFDEAEFLLVGNDLTLNWVEYHAATGPYDVAVERDPIFALNPKKRRSVFRFQVEGPFAADLLEYVAGKTLRDLAPFEHRQLRIGGVRVVVLRHSMTGAQGFELSGRWEARERVLGELLDAGSRYRVRRIGSLAYFTNALESGWFPGPIPAIYTGEELRPYREWLPATGGEVSRPLSGSFYSERIEDYYTTPFELGYGKLIHWGHDFIGRERLMDLRERAQRRKVMLIWDRDDVARLLRMAVLRDPGPVKYLELPLAQYGSKFDRVEDGNGRLIGLAHWTGFLATEGTVVSIGLVDAAYAVPGTMVTVVWGEADERRARGWADEHSLFCVRARVTLPPLNPLARVRHAR